MHVLVFMSVKNTFQDRFPTNKSQKVLLVMYSLWNKPKKKGKKETQS